MPPSSPIMEPLKERAGWCAGYLGEEAVAEMRPLLQENAGQVSIRRATHWVSLLITVFCIFLLCAVIMTQTLLNKANYICLRM